MWSRTSGALYQEASGRASDFRHCVSSGGHWGVNGGRVGAYFSAALRILEEYDPAREGGSTMGHTNEVVRGRADRADRLVERAEAAEEAASECAEHLTRDFAKVRARAAVDPVLAGRSLSAAWTTDVMEEDEAEFVDAVADCMGAGLSLESALSSWDTGAMVADDDDDPGGWEDEAAVPTPMVVMAQRSPRGARRVYVR